ncbi:NADP-dependent oxidoreductase [Azospirillum sp. 412522]|nr:NADP-dependent oxidoreductase [Azospirillum sp. 412522]MBY6264863.1 NADP-dependent oxidoreductase [Azospirillum sp. 412522]
MKAVSLSAYGADPVIADIPEPVIAADEVLVRVGYAALNPLDVKLQQRVMHEVFPLGFPYSPGTDLAGTVVAVGHAVVGDEPGGWREGDRVVARLDPTRGGAFAQFAAVPAAQLVAVPPALDLALAAGLPTAAGTAWQALFEDGGLKAGQTVLVHAGAGGVGSFAIQSARTAGARVIATASGTGLEIARKLGADLVIDHRAERFETMVSDVDLVLDTIGGDTQQRSFGVLRTGGVLLATSAPPDGALAKAHGVAARFVFHSSDARRLGQVVDAVVAGSLAVLVDRQVPLEGVADAFRHQASGRARGKILVSLG